ncbi:MAG: BrnT family toxin [Planctomycetes bacterium]|nr:BrnT family toxin [Planctomycetota bacterium]
MGDLRFAWDARKAARNLRKHGVSFEEARTAFTDEGALVLPDPAHSGDEERFVLLGLSERLRLLVVVHTLRENGDTLRLVSARKATSRERRQYLDRLKP